MQESLSIDTAGFLQTATDAALESGRLLKDIFGEKREIHYKGAIDLVTDADLKAEQIIAGRLKKEYPEHSILTEERESVSRDLHFQWIIDPLDGTTNYAHRFPWFCVSIALAVDSKVIIGVVYQPMLDQLFWAEKNRGAHLNEKPIRVSNNGDLDRSLLATGFPYNVKSNPTPIIAQLKSFLTRTRGIRRAGSAALDLCYVALGCFDGFWEINLKPWDTAAGSLIVSEAGGTVTDFEGRPYSMFKPELLCTNGRLHDEMLSVIRSTRK